MAVAGAQETIPDTILRLDNVAVTYPGGVMALRGTTIGFRSGEFSVLLGRSGAGKSTLLRAINHLVSPTSGRIVSREFGVLGPADLLRHTGGARRRSSSSISSSNGIGRSIMCSPVGLHSTARCAACSRCPAPTSSWRSAASIGSDWPTRR
jgi:phosphonate transport system ATP-binding protein